MLLGGGAKPCKIFHWGPCRYVPAEWLLSKSVFRKEMFPCTLFLFIITSKIEVKADCS